MIDVSATGATVTVKAAAIGQVTISRFSDEGTPFEFNEIEVTGSALSLNGEVIFWSKPVAYAASVTVIPHSDEDDALRKLLEASHVRFSGGSTKAVDPANVNTSLTLKCPHIDGAGQSFKMYSYTNGRIVSGPTAPSTSPEGKLSARTYTFVFEQMSES